LTGGERWIPVGRVGRPHGRDGSFYVDGADHPLAAGSVVRAGERELRIDRRAGTDERPLVRLEGIDDRDAASALRGETLLLPQSEAPLAEDEWLVTDLVGCRVPGLGAVTRVIPGPSCDVLEVGERGVLVPFVSDAVRRVDVGAGIIEVDLDFLALDERAAEEAPAEEQPPERPAREEQPPEEPAREEPAREEPAPAHPRDVDRS
jgi:16S rRNA processing protein RimM